MLGENQWSISAAKKWVIRRNRVILGGNNASFESFYATRKFLPSKFSAWRFGDFILEVSSDETPYCVSKWSKLTWKVKWLQSEQG